MAHQCPMSKVYITHSTELTKVEYRSYFELTDEITYLAIAVELYGISCEYLVKIDLILEHTLASIPVIPTWYFRVFPICPLCTAMFTRHFLGSLSWYHGDKCHLAPMSIASVIPCDQWLRLWLDEVWLFSLICMGGNGDSFYSWMPLDSPIIVWRQNHDTWQRIVQADDYHRLIQSVTT